MICVSWCDSRNSLIASRPSPSATDRIFVDAVSGKDGHPLWCWHENTPKELFTKIGAPRWWGLGPDGWPLLAIAIGGPINPDASPGNFRRATVHVLEASTGREVHSVDGLTHPQVADFDGDGLTDLWGEADGQIRAFRGEPPEAWRALGISWTAGGYLRNTSGTFGPTVDFDGDRIADTLSGDIIAPSRSKSEPIGSRTLVARSGRDGRVLWKTTLDPRRRSDDDDGGEIFGRQTFPLPGGDFDGDGTPDVFVTRSLPNPQKNKRQATLPLDLLSGRTGAHLWAAGPLPLAFDAIGYSNIRNISVFAIGPRAAPDVLVHHGSAFVKGGLPPLPTGPFEPHLARLSGRDGRVLWDILLADQEEPNRGWNVAPPAFDDIDGDGSLDALVVVRTWPAGMGWGFELNAVSLRDGKLIWNKAKPRQFNSAAGPEVALGDLDGDKRPEVVVMEAAPQAAASRSPSRHSKAATARCFGPGAARPQRQIRIPRAQSHVPRELSRDRAAHAVRGLQ